MKNMTMSLLAIALLTLICSGCNKGPDPKANPNFQEKSLMDPSAIKMGAEAPKPMTNQ
jgi:PBP1b-binding outer membrane lipoprotein LpoB